eukprot:gene17022-23312_t
MLRRLLYKNASQHRGSHFLRKLREVDRKLQQLKDMQLPSILDDLNSMVQIASSQAEDTATDSCNTDKGPKAKAGGRRSAAYGKQPAQRLSHCLPFQEAAVFAMRRLLAGYWVILIVLLAGAASPEVVPLPPFPRGSCLRHERTAGRGQFGGSTAGGNLGVYGRGQFWGVYGRGQFGGSMAGGNLGGLWQGAIWGVDDRGQFGGPTAGGNLGGSTAGGNLGGLWQGAIWGVYGRGQFGGSMAGAIWGSAAGVHFRGSMAGGNLGGLGRGPIGGSMAGWGGKFGGSMAGGQLVGPMQVAILGGSAAGGSISGGLLMGKGSIWVGLRQAGDLGGPAQGAIGGHNQGAFWGGVLGNLGGQRWGQFGGSTDGGNWGSIARGIWGV